jgi:hypothetical protein
MYKTTVAIRFGPTRVTVVIRFRFTNHRCFSI